MNNIPRLTDLEIIIMKALWEHENGLTIQEITACITEKKLSVASVAQAIKHMGAKGAVRVSEHVPVANVYARKFCVCFNQEQFLAAEFKRLQKSVFGDKKLHSAGIAAAFIGNSQDEEMEFEEIEELQQMMQEKKEKITRGE